MKTYRLKRGFFLALAFLLPLAGVAASSTTAHHHRKGVASAQTHAVGAQAAQHQRKFLDRSRVGLVTEGIDDPQSELRYVWAMRVLVALAVIFAVLFLRNAKSLTFALPELALVALFLYFASIVLRPL